MKLDSQFEKIQFYIIENERKEWKKQNSIKQFNSKFRMYMSSLLFANICYY